MQQFSRFFCLTAFLVFTAFTLFPMPVTAQAESDGLVLDVFATGGKLLDVKTSADDDVYGVYFTTPESQWFMKGEIGVTAPAQGVRVFVAGENLTNVYTKWSAGADWALYSGSLGTFGLRGEYSKVKTPPRPSQKYFYGGAFAKVEIRLW